MIGTNLAHYRVTAELGAGGMGEVWRAEDTKLGLEVALKVLPEELAKDPDRMARFEREAKVLASLNHPNIATLYGLETAPVIPGEPAATPSVIPREAPVWVGNSELFFWNGDRFFAVPVRTTPELSIGEPEAFFEARRYTRNMSQEYCVTADGRRFLMATIPEASKPREVQIVLNWFTELERLAGPGGAR